jgi:hypothetical protein
MEPQCGINIGNQCYTGTTWDSSFCPDPKSCAKNCAIDGVEPLELEIKAVILIVFYHELDPVDSADHSDSFTIS